MRALPAALLCAALAAAPAAAADLSSTTLRVGYFTGGRTSLLARMQHEKAFAAAGLNVVLLTKELRGDSYSPLDLAAFADDAKSRQSKVAGPELMDGLQAGRWELATPGEASFVEAAARRRPLVAVAALGHDTRGASGHVFAVRKGVSVDRPADYKGLLLLSRRAGPGDRAMLREYLQHAGVDLAKDAVTLPALPRTAAERRALPSDKVLLVDNVDDDVMRQALIDGVADGGYVHLMTFERMRRRLQLVAPLESWFNPETSMALLVSRREFLKSPENRALLLRFLKAYIAAIRRERALKPWERKTRGDRWERQQSRLQGLNYPQYDDVPIVKPYLLEEVADVLRRHAGLAAEGPLDFRDYVDNSLVLQAASELELKPSWE